MIPASAVKRYLSRPLDDHTWIKELKRKQLLELIDELRPRPTLNKKLYTHQLACFLLGVAYPQFAFFLDMGAGKTILTLELLRYWKQCGRLRRALVFLTSDKAYRTWSKQIDLYGIGMSHALLRGSFQEKWRAWAEFDQGIMFVSYPGATHQATVTEKVKGRTKHKLDLSLVKDLATELDAVTLDESTRVGNHQSLIHNLIAKLMTRTPIHYALAGRPFGRDPTMLWAQMKLIDGGETLGTLGLFREAFFTSSENPWVPARQRAYVRDWTFDKRKKGALSQVIQHRSITYADHECIDVPKFVSTVEEVRFSEEAEAYYQRAVEALIAQKGGMRAIKNLFVRMRQLSSGFVGFKDDETGDKAEVEFSENPKFDRLMDLIAQVSDDRQIIVFYDFTYSGRKITKALQELKIPAIWLWSGTKDYERDLAEFEGGKRRVAVVNNRVGAYSLDGLQVANYVFFYESPVSCIDREQAERRARRPGQRYKVFQYDVIVEGSMDEKILDYHREGADLLKDLLHKPSQLVARSR